MYVSDYHRRCGAVFFLFFIFLLFSVVRLAYLQFFRSSYLSGIARRQHNLMVELEPRRGTIYDCNFKPQAINIAADSLYASPNEISDKDKPAIISRLSAALGLSPAYLRDRLYRKKSFIWLARKISPQQAEAVRKMRLKGLDLMKESKRCYPNSYLGSHVLGFAGLDNSGLEGLELYYDKYLKGQAGWALILRDARQKKLDLSEKMVLPRDGDGLVLNIDEVVQYIAERELDSAFKKSHADGASIVVLEPFSGRILAMANRPSFDCNEYASASKEQLRDRLICDLFEPGSVFKIVTASAAIEEKIASEADRIFCENGSYRVANHILHDHTSHGWLTFREVIEQSSNIGTVKVAQVMGAPIVYKYARLFGFGAKLGIDIPGEINGMIKDPRFWSKTSIGAVPMGQEVGVTALQLAAAIAVIANGGQLMKPYLVRRISDKYGETVKEFSPQVIRRVISAETASRIRQILAGVVENGTGKLAKPDGFSAGGKTGTAQKLEANGAYSHDKFVASFIGFAPADNPAVAIAVVLDQPHPLYYGGVVAGPVFKNVATDVLRYLNIKQAEPQMAAADSYEITAFD